MKTANLTVLCLAVLAATSAVGVATAADAPSQRTVRISAIDLSDGAHIAQLYSRLRVAAADVCTALNTGTMGTLTVVSTCRERAIAQAVNGVHSPLLTSYHLSQQQQTTLMARR
jgi:UrcA family protein